MPRALDPARAAARSSGARLYLSPSPCKAGHPAGERYTSTGACRQCVAGQSRPGRVRRVALALDDPAAGMLE